MIQIHDKQLFTRILPSAVDGQYFDFYKEKSGAAWRNEKAKRDVKQIQPNELRNYDRFQGTSRPPLTAWRTFAPAGGDGVSLHPPLDRAVVRKSDQEKAREYELKRKRGMGEAKVDMEWSDDGERPPPKFNPTKTFYVDPFAQPAVFVDNPGITEVASAPILPEEAAAPSVGHASRASY